MGPPLRQQRREAPRVDRARASRPPAALAHLDRRGGPVQLHVGRAEAGPVVVVVAAQLRWPPPRRRRAGRARSRCRRSGPPPSRPAAAACRRRTAAPGVRVAAVAGRQPVGDVDVDLQRRAGPAQREQRAARPGRWRCRPAAWSSARWRDRDRPVGGEPGQLVLAELAQRRGGDLVDLPEQVGGVAALGARRRTRCRPPARRAAAWAARGPARRTSRAGRSARRG